MSRKSSIHFKPVANVRFAVSHSERTDLSEPAYLLSKEHQLPNIVLAGSLNEGGMAALFIQQKAGMTGQAKARGSSPFWEGVVVLPNTNGPEQSSNLQSWKNEYEKATGHKVLHMAIHLDEGYIDDAGGVHYNPHAHVIVSRMDERNRVIKLERKQLSEVQDLTAKTLQMERGSTLAERAGKRGRAHVPHKEFRLQADAKRLELDREKNTTALYGKLIDAQNIRSKEEWQQLKDAKAEVSKKDAELTQLKAQIEEKTTQYQRDRDALKASGEATQGQLQAQIDQLKSQAQREAARRAPDTTDINPLSRYHPDNIAKREAQERDLAAAAILQSNKTREAVPLTPAPIPPSPPLANRLQESLDAMAEWIRAIGGQQEAVKPSDQCFGPVKHMDRLHCVQKTGRNNYTLHRLADLDKMPGLDDPKMEIKYRNGVGQVVGKFGQVIER